jgi:hypothetical protein
MRAWIQDVDKDNVAFVHGVSGEDLDTLATHCREAGENQQHGTDMKLAARVDGAVIMDWCNKRGIAWDVFMRDSSLQKKFLDDPHNSAFRVWKGRI